MSLRPCIVCALVFGSGLLAEYPVAKISNSEMQVTVYLPDAKDGFYKGLRFDWSGMIASVEAGGHSYYGPWFARVDPAVRDFAYQDSDIVASSASAALGPAEEFQVPLGYDTAKPGETFVKVGVGVLLKADDSPYSSYKTYEVVDTGTWSVKKTGDTIQFTQTLNSPKSDYKYLYTKTIRLASNKAEMSIDHTLRNTGPAPIHTRLYDHNFLRIDNAEVGPDLVVTLPFEIKPTRAADPLSLRPRATASSISRPFRARSASRPACKVSAPALQTTTSRSKTVKPGQACASAAIGPWRTSVSGLSAVSWQSNPLSISPPNPAKSFPGNTLTVTIRSPTSEHPQLNFNPSGDPLRRRRLRSTRVPLSRRSRHRPHDERALQLGPLG